MTLRPAQYRIFAAVSFVAAAAILFADAPLPLDGLALLIGMVAGALAANADTLEDLAELDKAIEQLQEILESVRRQDED